MLPAIITLLRKENVRLQGPSRTYGPSHVIIVLLSIGDAGAIGRHALAQRAGLGEGAIRTVIKRLVEGGYIKVKSPGCELTRRGKEVYHELKKTIPQFLSLSKTSLTVGREQVAVLIKGASSLVTNGIIQRDAVIKVGALGATTYIIKDSKFQIPPSVADCEKEFPGEIWNTLTDELRPQGGDVVIICGSHDQIVSTIGAVSAALTLVT